MAISLGEAERHSPGIQRGWLAEGATVHRQGSRTGFCDECIELVTKLKLCTDLQIGRAAAVISTADEGPRTQNEDPDDPSTIADDCRTYLWKIDRTAAYR